MALTDLKIRRAKAGEKPYKLFDSNGLYIHVQPNGSKLWRWKYQYAKKERLLSYGPYPLREPRGDGEHGASNEDGGVRGCKLLGKAADAHPVFV